MTHDPEFHRILREHLHDPSSSFSVGSFGAIAEFHRDADEPLVVDEPEQLTIADPGGIEGAAGTSEGPGLLDVETLLAGEKRLAAREHSGLE